MTDRPNNVLFLCTGFVDYSAGSSPKGKVHPIALDLLEHNSFAGIREADVPGFIAAHAVGALDGALLLRAFSERKALAS